MRGDGRTPREAAISWTAGTLASAGGLWVSFHYDLPTGPVVVCMFGFLQLVAYALRQVLGRRADALLAPLGGSSAALVNEGSEAR